MTEPTKPPISIWTAIMLGLKGLLQSKKFLTALFTMIANLVLKFGIELDVDQAVALTSPMIAAIFGQTVVDVRTAGSSQKVDGSVSSGTPPTSNTPVMLALFFGAAALIGGAVLGSGCDQARGRATAGAKAFVECGKAEVKAIADEFVPMATKAVLDAIRGDGKVDRPTLSSVVGPLKSAATRCAADAAIASVLNPPAPKEGAPQSEPLLVDRADLAAAYNEIRATAWGGVEIRSANSP